MFFTASAMSAALAAETCQFGMETLAKLMLAMSRYRQMYFEWLESTSRRWSGLQEGSLLPKASGEWLKLIFCPRLKANLEISSAVRTVTIFSSSEIAIGGRAEGRLSPTFEVQETHFPHSKELGREILELQLQTDTSD